MTPWPRPPVARCSARLVSACAQVALPPEVTAQPVSTLSGGQEAKVALAAVLLAEGPDKHAGKRYRPTGPQLLNGREMAAIVAREYGLPAVVGTGHATKRIVTGQRLRVDGTSGIVTILD